MKVVVAIDSFKGSLSTFAAGEAARTGVLRACPDARVEVCPLADGGEGTTEAIVSATGGDRVLLTVTGPHGRPVQAAYGVTPDGIAVLEMASAAGITLVSGKEKDPLTTTTYGVGEMIAHAIAHGVRRFVIGIGGSATNDGGVGMLSALGFSFLDADGQPISRGAQGLASLARIETAGALPALSECEFRVACDVTNPLCGERGCSAVYGPQKGATPESVARMDAWLSHYAALTRAVLPSADPDFPGAGAAGGLGFAFLAYLGGRLSSGVALVIETTGIEHRLMDADLVITGEGRLDGQSCMGKAPVGIARAAKRYGKTVLALSGCVTEDATVCNRHGIDAFFPILPAPCTLAEAMNEQNAAHNLAATAEQAVRLFLAGRRKNR